MLKNFLKWQLQMWPILLLYAYLILMGLSLMAGCSATKEIASRVNNVRNQATDIRDNVAQARENLESGNIPGVQDNLTNIDGSAVIIQGEADAVGKRLPEVQDRTPWWANLLKWGFAAVVVGGILYVLWRFNLILLVENLIGKIVGAVAKWMV